MSVHSQILAVSLGAVAISFCHDAMAGAEGSRPAYSLLHTMIENTDGRTEIVHVTNLKAKGPGSFAEAISGGSDDVTRIVVFDVSGEIVLPKVNYNIRDRISTVRENLWIAGQTAPAPDSGSGRGITLRGRLQHRQGPFVIEHIRIRPVDGRGIFDNRNEDGRGLLFAPNRHANRGDGGAVGCVLWRNVSVEWTQDVIGAIGSSTAKGPNIPYAENVCVDNCLFAEPLNWKMADQAGDYDDGHSYGLNVRGAAFRVLIRGTVHASAFNRTPQFSQCSSGLAVNNYTFVSFRQRCMNCFSVIGIFRGDRRIPLGRRLMDWAPGGTPKNPFAGETDEHEPTCEASRGLTYSASPVRSLAASAPSSCPTAGGVLATGRDVGASARAQQDRLCVRSELLLAQEAYGRAGR